MVLSEGFVKFPEIKLAYTTQSNEVFVHLPSSTINLLNAKGYNVSKDELDGKSVRFVTAWNTVSDDIEKLLSTISNK